MSESGTTDGLTTTALTIIESATMMPVPAMIAGAGERAALRFIDFFTAHIRNPITRAAYGVAVRGLFTWLELRGLAELGAIRTHHVSTYIETLTHRYSAPTVKQHLAAIRRLFDWLIVGQVIDQNPAAPVRGPTHIVKKARRRCSTATRRASSSTASTSRPSSGCATAR